MSGEEGAEREVYKCSGWTWVRSRAGVEGAMAGVLAVATSGPARPSDADEGVSGRASEGRVGLSETA